MAASQSTLFDLEQWLPVAGYEGYYDVSNRGRVKSLARTVIRSNGVAARLRGKIRKLTPLPGGHLQVPLSRAGERKFYLVHRLVLEAFVGPCPPGMEACHWNDVPDDNRLENLRWGTSKENEQDKLRNSGHYLANKPHCHRGHLLAPPNLRNDMLRQGWRACKSCNRADSYVRFHPELRPNIQQISDSYYEQIMGRADV